MTDANIMFGFCACFAGLSLAKSESRALPFVFAAGAVFTFLLAAFNHGHPL